MNNTKIKIYLAISLLLLAGIVIVVIYSYSSGNKSGTQTYPQSVQSAINNPLEKHEDWSTLATTNTFDISYTKDSTGDSFVITLFAQPVVSVSEQAEQIFLQKLGIQKDYACTLPVVIRVPAMVDQNLWGKDFGLSFCPGKTHIADASKPLDIPPGDTFYIKTTSGGSLLTKNFYKTALKIDSATVTIASNNSYSVSYVPHDDSFYVYVDSSNVSNFSQIASSAAATLEKALNISQTQICQVPAIVDWLPGDKNPSSPRGLAYLIGCP